MEGFIHREAYLMTASHSNVCFIFLFKTLSRHHIFLVILKTTLTSALSLTQTSHTAPPSAQRMGLREATRMRGNAPLPNLPHHRERLRPTRRPPSQDLDPVPGRQAKAPPLPQPSPGPRRGAPNQHTLDATSGTATSRLLENTKFYTRCCHKMTNDSFLSFN